MVHDCMVYTECAEVAAVSKGTSHGSTVSTPLQWIFKNALDYKKLFTHVESHASTVTLLESGEYSHTKVINNNNTFFTPDYCVSLSGFCLFQEN